VTGFDRIDTSAVQTQPICNRLNEVYGKNHPLKLQNSREAKTLKDLHKTCLHNSW